MDVVVTVEGPGAADELRSLRTWLLDDDDFRGQVHLQMATSTRGTLSGGVVEWLTITAGAAGPALATVLVTWLRTRVGQLRLKVTRPDGGAVELTAEQVRGLDADGAWERIGRVADLMAGQNHGEAGGPVQRRDPPVAGADGDPAAPVS